MELSFWFIEEKRIWLFMPLTLILLLSSVMTLASLPWGGLLSTIAAVGFPLCFWFGRKGQTIAGVLLFLAATVCVLQVPTTHQVWFLSSFVLLGLSLTLAALAGEEVRSDLQKEQHEVEADQAHAKWLTDEIHLSEKMLKNRQEDIDTLQLQVKEVEAALRIKDDQALALVKHKAKIQEENKQVRAELTAVQEKLKEVIEQKIKAVQENDQAQEELASVQKRQQEHLGQESKVREELTVVLQKLQAKEQEIQASQMQIQEMKSREEELDVKIKELKEEPNKDSSEQDRILNRTQGMLNQMRAQFEEKKTQVDLLRRELFHVNEKKVALQRELDERAKLGGSEIEMREIEDQLSWVSERLQKTETAAKEQIGHLHGLITDLMEEAKGVAR